MNLPRLDDDRFDMPVMPLNVMYGGQPATTVPVADPSTPEPAPLMAAAALREVLAKYFDRQGVALASPKARGADRTRWDRELSEDLHAAGMPPELAAELAKAVNAETFALVDGVGDNAAALRAVFEMTKSVRLERIAAAA
jgi:hypothetical protein